MNVFGLLSNASRRWSGKIAIRYGDRKRTYAELTAEATAFGVALRRDGLGEGDRVVIFLRNGLEFAAVLFGLIGAGLIAVPVNAKLHPREVAYIIENCGAEVLVTDADMAAAIGEVAGSALRLIVVGDAGSEHSFERVVNNGRLHRNLASEVSSEQPAWLFYTSGTTGRPKGAVLSHRNIIAMAVNCLADIFPFQPEDRALHVAPLSHGSGIYLLPSLARGTENIIFDGARFDPDLVLAFIAREQITVLPFVAPTMIVRLLDGAQGHDLSSLRCIVYGGAPIHLEHLRAAVRHFGPILVQLYGQGEAPMTISYLSAAAHLSDDDDLLRSAGFVRTGVEVSILDAEGRALPHGEAGEIAVRGDVVMTGYWHDEKANAEAFHEGWLRTGDIGRFGADGRLFLLERKHDTIISGGSNIYPREVEEVLTKHPAVKEAIVFGVPDTEWGESVAAAIVPRPEARLSERELVDFCNDYLARFKRPKVVHIVAELPKNAYGKVLRRELRAAFARKDTPV
ncbi:MAG: class I adenylate-forming enzyme family protein [Xanthobacteraceae bacterium]